ncbi:dipeptidase [Roseivirga thermotolerans]|jgi:membrane dipeptidase|uniref:Peptidase M19 n=1 Tax=Roseivirga thermotolerans TaxID=1758176 RepID=A0ABQ3I7T6_9BACT|nr:dipeptidase [Roseivirga thermotolerans]GHE71776.1 peptidase M19 [Roseivirga thermotolerans]
MIKRFLSLASATLIFWSCGPKEKETTDVSNMTEEELINYAKGVHDRVITLDTHDDINTTNFTEETNYTQRLSTQVNLPKMEEGGLDVAWFVVYTGQGELSEEGYARAYENADDKFKAIHRLCEEIAPDKIELAYTSDDVRRIVAAGKKVAMIGVENAYPLGMEIDRVKEFYDRGARYMSLSHNGHSQLSDSNTGERDSVWLHNGLSDFGKQVVAEMNKWGIMIDLSHPSKEANMQAMRLSKAPVIASHSSARALNDVSRNMDDEQLMMLKENGGVIQTVAFKSYVNAEKNRLHSEKMNEVMERIAGEEGFEIKSRSELREMSAEDRESYYEQLSAFREKHGETIEKEVNAVAPPVDVADFVDHIDYLVKKIGLEHVGISSDFDGGGGIEGWSDASETFNVTLELVRRGYTEEQIAKLWSGNLLRVLDECQAIAKKIQAGEL